MHITQSCPGKEKYFVTRLESKQHECNRPFNFDNVTKPVSKYNFIHQSLKILHPYIIT